MLNIRYIVEAFILAVILIFFRILPLDVASYIGGLVLRLCGPHVKAHKTADANMQSALPMLSAEERALILRDMWDNLGRIIAEYPHLSRKIMKKRITIHGIEHLETVKHSGKGSFFVSGHFANWEIAPLTAALYGLPLVLIYRAPNNPFSDWIIRNTRYGFSRAMFNKGREGAQRILKAVKKGEAVGILIDQKLNEGKPISFFGREAMTATATTAMAIKQQVPLLLARVVRTKGAYFDVSVRPPVFYDKTADAIVEMEALHRILEGWISEYPAQWFWVHKRWR